MDKILEQWATERPDLDASPMGVIGRISRLARTYERVMGAGLAKFGLQNDEFDVLATLRRSGRPLGLKPKDLIDSMMVSSATITQRIDKLEARGLIERRPDPGDRRGVIVRLTSSGKKVVDRAVANHVTVEAELLETLSPQERDVLCRLLRRLALTAEAP